MIYSSIGIHHPGDKDSLGYSMTESAWKGYAMSISTFNHLELGMKLYATQTMLDENGRRVLVGWIKTGKPLEGEGFSGLMCTP